MKKLIAIGAAVVVMAGLAGTTGAVAANVITSHQIADGTIKAKDLRPGLNAKIAKHGKDGADGKPGAPGKDATFGAVYRVENYLNGGGGSATVACADTEAESQKYTAIAGGVQGSNSGTTETQTGFLVSSSFPGRMDWDTGQPKANRLDGWIVFGNSQYTDTLKVWALCVPTTSIPVQTVDLDN